MTDPALAGEPPRQLKGFQKVSLGPGQSTRVTFSLDRRALSFWDPALRQWVAPSGDYTIAVGDSSRSLPLQARFGLVHTLVSGVPTPDAPVAPRASLPTAAGDAATCWQDVVASLVNGGLSITGGSVPANASELPIG